MPGLMNYFVNIIMTAGYIFSCGFLFLDATSKFPYPSGILTWIGHFRSFPDFMVGISFRSSVESVSEFRYQERSHSLKAVYTLLWSQNQGKPVSAQRCCLQYLQTESISGKFQYTTCLYLTGAFWKCRCKHSQLYFPRSHEE